MNFSDRNWASGVKGCRESGGARKEQKRKEESAMGGLNRAKLEELPGSGPFIVQGMLGDR